MRGLKSRSCRQRAQFGQEVLDRLGAVPVHPFPKPIVATNLKPARRSDVLRGLTCATQRSAEDGAQAELAQPLPDARGLPSAILGQPRVAGSLVDGQYRVGVRAASMGRIISPATLARASAGRAAGPVGADLVAVAAALH